MVPEKDAGPPHTVFALVSKQDCDRQCFSYPHTRSHNLQFILLLLGNWATPGNIYGQGSAS